ncbi:XRE family transcriptional regulator [Nocardioides mangrovicus]|uniref:XRE family transcriptional regulator n=1 Tax=Nocardioides mangrovicus TaxID=2478913 RepID=A0A3L8NXM1_9ACTN|nr:helix-turn-helix transcriptional regulator [Nocardioides mangrovicus]RLV47966.1 XRE family transcriptional regulator [Nocardioides mangrovicus]
MDFLGERLRQARLNAGLTMRELARSAQVSPSLISQIENGKSQPSVATLYTFSRVLGVSVDELFESSDEPAPAATSLSLARVGHSTESNGFVDPAHAWRPSEYATRISVVHPSHRSRLAMAEGVEWERLAATPERGVNFMRITYAPGASSSVEGDLQAHEAYEYGYVLSGEVEVTVGEEVFVLREGESLGFDSTIPHVLHNRSDEVFTGIWFVHGHRH